MKKMILRCRNLKCICYKCSKLKKCIGSYCKGRIIEPDCKGYKYCIEKKNAKR